MTKALVLGGSGYLGSSMAKALAAKGWHVTVVSTRPRSADFSSLTSADWAILDLTDLNAVQSFFKANRFDFVLNFSGYVSHVPYDRGGWEVLNTHFIGVLNVIKSIDRGTLKKFLHIGSSEESNYLNIGSARCYKSPYAFAKNSVTEFLLSMNQNLDFPVTIIRLFLVYGPGQAQNRLIPFVIENCLYNRTFAVSSGYQIRNFLFIDDLVPALLTVIDSTDGIGEVFDLGSLNSFSVREVVIKLVNMIGAGCPEFGKISPNNNDATDLIPDLRLFNSKFQWSENNTLEQGLNKTIQYYRTLVKR